MNSSLKHHNKIHDQLKKIHDQKSPTSQTKTPKTPNTSNPGHHEAEAALALAWESLFSYFCDTSKLDLRTLNTIATIIRKLSTAYTQIQAIELKSKDSLIKEEEFKAKKEQFLASLNSSKIIPIETFQKIEKQFNLLQNK